MAKQELVSSRVVELKVNRVREYRASCENELISVPQKEKDGYMVHRKSRNDKGIKRVPYGSRASRELVAV